jgi:SAM-dependent methyltransferase
MPGLQSAVAIPAKTPIRIPFKMLNLLLPWRWKRSLDRILDAKLQLTREFVATALDDARTQLEARVGEQRAVSESMITVLNNLRALLEGRVAEQRAASDSVIAVLNDLQAQLNGQFATHGEVSKSVAAQSTEIAQLREETYQLRQSLFTEYDDALLHKLRSAARDLQRGLSAVKNEIAAQLGFSLHDMASQVADQRRWLEGIDADLAAHKAWLEKVITEKGNEFLHLESGIESRLNGLETAAFETRNMVTHLDTSLHTRLNTLETVNLPVLFERIDESEQIHGIAAAQIRFTAQQANRSLWRPHPEERYAPAKPRAFEAYLACAAREFPKAFDLWRERLETMRIAFEQTKVGNAAHAADLYSRIFHDFVEIHATGRVLDVGCGVFGRPYYLCDYPSSLISGLEPLPMQDPADFELIQGIAEYLPWPDASFSTVISATSLDHCLSLDQSLDELMRVLRPDGRILLWIGSNPGSPKFEPDDPDFAPADRFHLFHFDKAWFEPLLEERFEFVDRLEFKRPSYSHILYSLRPRQDRRVGAAEPPRLEIAGKSR